MWNQIPSNFHLLLKNSLFNSRKLFRKEFIQLYKPEYIEELAAFIREQDFHFKSFMAAYKFYNQYALKTNDGEYYLESMEEACSLMRSILPTVMKQLPKILLMKSFINVINLLLKFP